MNIENRKKININGVEIAYIDQGNGMPIVFIHGFAAHADSWQFITPVLSQTFRTIALDLKGFGASDKPDDDHYSAFDQANMLAAFINALGITDCYLAGHSFGGFIALLSVLSKKIKGQVRGIILLDSVGYFTKLPEFIATLKVPFLNKLLLDKLNITIIARMVLKKVFYDDEAVPETLVRAYADVLVAENAKKSFIKSAEQFTSDKTKQACERFGKITMPVLILWGVDDAVIPVQDSYRFKHALPRAELVLLPECGHSPQEECPEDIITHMIRFIEVN